MKRLRQFATLILSAGIILPAVAACAGTYNDTNSTSIVATMNFMNGESEEQLLPVAPTSLPLPEPTETRLISTELLTPSPLPTPAVTASPMAIMTDTATIATGTPFMLLQGPVLALVQAEPLVPNSLLLWDIGSGSERQLQFDNGRPVNINWSEDGCWLQVILRTSSGIELVRTSLDGSTQASMFQYMRDDPDREPTTFHDNWSFSPSQTFIAYLVFSGEHFYATSEFQDLEVVAANHQSERYRLTSNGGTLDYAWSPDGQYIAYSDYDASGVRQLYRSRPDGSEKIGLTFFTEKGASRGEPAGNFLGKPVWSPDGNRIGLETGVTNEDGTVTFSLWMLDTNGEAQVELLPGSPSRKLIMGWDEAGTVLASYVYDGNTAGNLYWIDTTNGNLLSEWRSGQVPESDVHLAAAVQGVDVWLGLDANGTAYLYNAETEKLEMLQGLVWPAAFTLLDLAETSFAGQTASPTQLIDAALPPPEFLGETLCKP